jgi:hypothetical protein
MSDWRDRIQLWQLSLARVREFLREPEAVFWTFFFPVLMALALGIAFRDREPGPIPVGVERGGVAEVAYAALDSSAALAPRWLESGDRARVQPPRVARRLGEQPRFVLFIQRDLQETRAIMRDRHAGPLLDGLQILRIEIARRTCEVLRGRACRTGSSVRLSSWRESRPEKKRRAPLRERGALQVLRPFDIRVAAPALAGLAVFLVALERAATLLGKVGAFGRFRG